MSKKCKNCITMKCLKPTAPQRIFSHFDIWTTKYLLIISAENTCNCDGNFVMSHRNLDTLAGLGIKTASIYVWKFINKSICSKLITISFFLLSPCLPCAFFLFLLLSFYFSLIILS